MNTTTILQSGWAEALLYNLGNAILMTDMDLRVRYLNEAAEKLLGIPAGNAEGLPFKHIVHLQDEQSKTSIELPLAQILRQREFYHSEQGLVLKTENGLYHKVNISAVPLDQHPLVNQGLAIQISECAFPMKEILDAEGAEMHKNDLPGYFFVKKDGSFLKVMVGDVHWIEAMENYAILVTENGRFVVHSTLKKLANKLERHDFVRVHRSYIAPLDKIDAIEDNRLHIGSEVVPIGKSFRPELMRKLHFI